MRCINEICNTDVRYVDMKVSESAITMISIHVTGLMMSRNHVVENSLSLCVHKSCHEMTLKTLVDMQQFLIFSYF